MQKINFQIKCTYLINTKFLYFLIGGSVLLFYRAKSLNAATWSAKGFGRTKKLFQKLLSSSSSLTLTSKRSNYYYLPRYGSLSLLLGKTLSLTFNLSLSQTHFLSLSSYTHFLSLSSYTHTLSLISHTLSVFHLTHTLTHYLSY